jgi:anti-anti-sigma factor
MPDSVGFPSRNSRSTLSVDQLYVGDRAAVVSLEGDLALESAPRLKTVLWDLVATGRDRLVVDLAQVPFMDSTALGVMIGLQRRFADDERLAIAAPTAAVLRVLKLTGLATGLRVFATREAALSYVTEEDAPPAERATPALTADAALMLGIASTAMPFAQSAEDQAERWLRALRNHGESGAILASLGLSETAREDPEHDADADADAPERGDPDAVVTVSDAAGRIAMERGAPKLGTLDVLMAVSQFYGPIFYRVLAAHGVDPAELTARLAGAEPATAES